MEPPKSLWIEELSWPEVGRAIAGGYRRLLLCAASTEQHGPHLAENTDELFGRLLCGALARRLGGTLIGPVLRPGLSAHHMRHPGSFTLREETFRLLIEDCVDSGLAHGFAEIVLLASHGTNFAPLERLAEELAAKKGAKIVCGMKLSDFMELYSEGERMFGLEKGACGGHACCFETSVMLRYFPQYVQMDRAERGYMEGNTPEFAKNLFANGMMGVSPCGIIGDARCASAEMGEAFFELFCRRAVDCVRAALGEEEENAGGV